MDLWTKSPHSTRPSRATFSITSNRRLRSLRQVELLRPRGVLVVSDHVADPDRAIAEHHAAIEVARDRTHTRNLTGGELVDLLASAGLTQVRYIEESFTLDFDEWFDRGTPADSKANVRARLLEGPAIRSFAAHELPDGSVRIDGLRKRPGNQDVAARGAEPTPPFDVESPCPSMLASIRGCHSGSTEDQGGKIWVPFVRRSG